MRFIRYSFSLIPVIRFKQKEAGARTPASFDTAFIFRGKSAIISFQKVPSRSNTGDHLPGPGMIGI